MGFNYLGVFMWFYIKSFIGLLLCVIGLAAFFYGFVLVAVVLESKGKLIPILIAIVCFFGLFFIGYKVIHWIKNRD